MPNTLEEYFQQRLEIAKLIGDPVREQHEFEGKDDNRYFECRHCKLRQSWPDYRLAGRRHSEGECPGTDQNYVSDLNVLQERLVFTLRDSELPIYKKHLTAIMRQTLGIEFEDHDLLWAFASQVSEALLLTLRERPVKQEQ